LQESPGEDFRTTRWTQVSRAKADSPEGRRALAELCNAYYEPVAAFLRYDLPDADAARGDQAALAAGCGMNPNALQVAVHRLKRRFRQLLKAEVAGTLDDPSLVEAEMRALFIALGS
jgi:RNA polymerase sigma-70 factor (ECF subfamily)